MKEVYFKSILIADLCEHTARYHEFQRGLNVITSHENHMGKSSLLKSLYYSMGAEVGFDDRWSKKSKIYITEFIIDNIVYKIARFQKNFALFKEERLLLLTNNVSKELAKKLEEIFSFSVYLADKKDKKIILAPPALTYMPYYIDQDKGWAELYGSFERIDQFTKPERKKSLYYHLRIYTKDTIELMGQRDRVKSELDQLAKKEVDLKIGLKVLTDEMDNIVPAQNIDDLEGHLLIPKQRIENIVKELGSLRNEIQVLESALQQSQSQLDIICEYKKMKNGNMFEKKDPLYKCSCPHCGYPLDEELYNIVRENYNLRNEEYMFQQIQYIADSLKSHLSEKEALYVETINRLEKEENVYDESQDAYKVYLKQRGLQETYKKYSDVLNDNICEQHKKRSEIKKYDSQIRKIPNKKEIEDIYIKFVRENIIGLGAWAPSYERHIKLLKPIKAQGSLISKIILAQYIGIFQTMEAIDSNATRFPFVIDSPRGNEASVASSIEIIKLIGEISSLPQIILATVDYDTYKSKGAENVNVTFFNRKNALLCADDFEKYEEEIKGMMELLREVAL